MVDLSELLEPIAADSPCGDNLEYDAAYMALANAIADKPDDPFTGEKAPPPNWSDIAKEAQALLLRSKDLQLLIYLLRASIHLEGLPGFRDALALLQTLVENQWDDIHPQLDPDDALDPTTRLNILEELGNLDSVLRPLAQAPLAESKSIGRFSLRDVQLATDKLETPEGVNKPDVNLIKGAFLDMGGEALASVRQAVEDSLETLGKLERFVADQVGGGIDLAATRALLREMRGVFEQFAGAGEVAVESMVGGDMEEGGGAIAPVAAVARPVAAPGTIASRQDVVKTLDLICKYYADNEPSSPVPILLKRAKYLVTADFEQIVQNLLSDAVSQLDVLKGPEPESN